jgi:nucleotide-binding universal stress UspA family protein
MDIKRILVPVDFSELSTKALSIAQKLSSLFDATITPVHVHIPITEMDEPYALGMSSSVYQNFDKIEANLKERLTELAEEHIEKNNLEESVIAFGNPAQSIVDLSEDFDMIVMTTHGRTGFTRFLLGSVAEKVLRLAHAPVMVVENNSDVGNFEKLLVTTDFSENSAVAFPLAIEIAKKAGSKLHVLHILSYDQFEKDEKDISIERLRKERINVVANKYFHEIKKNLTYSVEVSEDSPHEAILNHVKQNDYNLILMATVGRTGINYLMMGSTTTNVVRHVHTAVISMNPKKGDESN